MKPYRPHRNTVRAKKVRAELIAKLGGGCARCGEANEEKLEFDHIHGRDYYPRDLSYLQRLNRYAQEAEAGLIRLLCKECNLAVRKTADNGRHIPTNAVVPRTADLELVEVEL